MKIALDAGHGFNTAGKRTPDGIREWTLNDRVLRAFDNEIKKYKGVTTVRLDDPTGKTDVGLTARTNKAKSNKCDVLISFHHNAFQSKWGNHGGTETWIYANRNSEKLGATLQRAMINALGLRDRGVKTGNMHMNREVPFPSALVEVGFMDSNTDKAIRDPKNSEKVGIEMAKEFAKLYKLEKVGGQAVKPAPKPQTSKKSVEEVAREVINGKWGNGNARKINLEKAGYDYNEVQKKVNELLGSNKKPSKPTFKQYSYTIPANTTLYNASGKAYPAKTGRSHKVTILEERNGLGRFKASWLVGVSEAWVKVGATSKPATNVGKTAQLRGKVNLYPTATAKTPYRVPSGRNRDLRIIAESNGRFKVSSPAFNPREVWINAKDVKVK